jgi:hypothetical protein
MSDQIFNGRPKGREDEHFVVRIDDRLKRPEESLHSSVHDDDVGRLGRDVVFGSQLICNCGSQLRNARGGRVTSLVLVERALHRLLDVLRRVHVGLAALELIDDGALRTQLHYSISNVDDIGKANVVEP